MTATEQVQQSGFISKLPRTYYRSACAMAYMLGYSFEEYVNRAVKQKIVADLEGAGELELDSNFYERIKQNRQVG